ncbi:hypothetical protein [Pseudomonas weihenstephanensis]|uniref:Uncharacterized protein n=1 Tax=Pseudomonas weihenstephanensis TaxID=1608994 RepID=A0ABS1ZMT9_9PSED|nr:hypothetical protein [Pseudomonas weihenstephanensis]MBM1197692.1 hypothetical protein [Pseudomonas weihenstephanensis]
MRTYILSMTILHTRQKATFRCEATTFSEAIDKAEKAHPGFFSVLTQRLSGEQNNATVNR